MNRIIIIGMLLSILGNANSGTLCKANTYNQIDIERLNTKEIHRLLDQTRDNNNDMNIINSKTKKQDYKIKKQDFVIKKQDLGFKQQDNEIKQDKNSKETNEDVKESTKTSKKKSITLSEADFSVTDSVNTFKLDSKYSKFTIFKNKKKVNETKTFSMGEIYGEDNVIYHTMYHEYDGITFHSSNLNYDFKEDDKDTYYLTQISVDSKDYKTKKGITIGSTREDILTIYGNPIYEQDNELLYEYQNYYLEFTLDSKHKVTDFTMYVQPLFEYM